MISPPYLSSLVSDQYSTVLYSFSFSKVGLLTRPACTLVSHLFASTHAVLVSLFSVST